MATNQNPNPRCPLCGRFTFHRSTCPNRDQGLPVSLDHRIKFSDLDRESLTNLRLQPGIEEE